MTVNFSEREYALLEELAAEKDPTVSESLRDAIALENHVEDTHRHGGRILVERDGTIRVVAKVR